MDTSSIDSSDFESNWNTYYEALIRFSHEFGHCNVFETKKYPLLNGRIINLGLWLKAQREDKQNNTIDRTKLAKLQALVDEGKLRWSMSQYNGVVVMNNKNGFRKWKRIFDALILYGEQFGSCNVPLKVDVEIDGSSFALGKWVDRQRQSYRKGTLCVDRLNLLQGLVDDGRFEWNLNVSLRHNAIDEDGAWQMMYEALLRYGKMRGHHNVGFTHTVTNIKGENLHLGDWLHRQRILHSKGLLKSNRLQLLKHLVDEGTLRLSLVEKSRHENVKNDLWLEYYNCLVQYGEKYGTCNIPQALESDLRDGTRVKLGSWLNKQRKEFSMGILLKEREMLLQALVDKGLLMWKMYLTKKSDVIESDSIPKSVINQDASFPYIGSEDNDGLQKRIKRSHVYENIYQYFPMIPFSTELIDSMPTFSQPSFHLSQSYLDPPLQVNPFSSLGYQWMLHPTTVPSPAIIWNNQSGVQEFVAESVIDSNPTANQYETQPQPSSVIANTQAEILAMAEAHMKSKAQYQAQAQAIYDRYNQR